MKIQIHNRRSFLNAFKFAAAVCPTRTPKPILKHVKIECYRNRNQSDADGTAADGTTTTVTMQATDLEVGVVVKVPDVEIIEEGEMVVPVDRFGSIISEASDNELTITSSNGECIIRGGRNRFRLLLIESDEFPAIDRDIAESSSVFSIDSAALTKAIRRTAFAASQTAHQSYALSGLKIEQVGGKVSGGSGKLTLVATDGKCLSYYESPSRRISGDAESSAIVMLKTASLVERMFNDPDQSGEVRIAIDDNRVLFVGDNATIYSRVLSGRFPRWNMILDRADDGSCVDIPAADFQTAIRQASVMITNETRAVEFAFSPEQLDITASAREAGDASVSIGVRFDREAKTCFDPQFILDYLRSVTDGEVISIRPGDGNSAATFSCDDAGKYIVMPMAKQGPDAPAAAPRTKSERRQSAQSAEQSAPAPA